MARFSAAFVLAVALLVLMVSHSAFAARDMQMSSSGSKTNVVDAATTMNPSGGNQHANTGGLTDNKNFVFGGVGSGIGGTAGVVGPFGGAAGSAGVASGVGGVAFPGGGLVGGGLGGGVGGGGIIP